MALKDLLSFAPAVLLGVAVLAGGARSGRAESEDKVDYETQIKPILSTYCYDCHGPDDSTREADFRLDLKESAFVDLGGFPSIAPGKPEDSELYYRISTEITEERMPPYSAGLELNRAEIELIRLWIQQGAEWDE